ncbi:DUF3923 family protein [Companilactobacillus nuruki]|uniref:NADH:ubiquinone oxidoreductase n=1 Tax=Companilactobacillus nuruki TaxID=1993540 RepID=A0A2N7AUH9_9LACO|nr:DUF3923 family protein [Companilactobacillus nuruki]PMD70763.1 NADH:ubiquinone oxidoreductase [Companilactobacillus nuruki]
MKVWKGLNIFWSIVFIIGFVWILIRKTDGAGVVQNSEIRMINLLVLVIAVILVGICQLAIRYFIKKSSN